ncbi:MAG: pitrilysin family protein [Myxococcota bacterium]|nr:pitrilysin family protein [Myxococcota bacterium]
MRTAGPGALLLGLALLLLPVPAPADALDAEPVVVSPSGFRDPVSRMVKTRLSNGLVVLTLEDHTTPVVSFQMWVKVGSRDESRYTGLAHLFEHMMFRGSVNIPPEMHARLVNARGGRTNAYTSRDYTVYFEDVTSESLPLVIELEAERLANLDISEENLKSERQVVLEERRMRTEDQPMGRAMEALMALTFQAHPYRWPPIGWRSDVERATVAASREFFDSYYAPNNIVIAIAGDFDSEEALDRIRRTFGKLEPVEIPRNPTQEPEQDGERRATVYFDLRGPILAAAWHAPKTGHEDGEALDVLSTILSTGRSSRLYRKLVYEQQSALAAQGGYWELDDAGVFYAVAQVRPGVRVEDVEASFMGEIERVKTSGVSEEEVEKAKRQMEVMLVNGLATNHSLAGRMGREVSTFGRVRPLDERLAAIRAVTPEDVQRVARTYLNDEKRSVVHVVPPPPGRSEEGT